MRTGLVLGLVAMSTAAAGETTRECDSTASRFVGGCHLSAWEEGFEGSFCREWTTGDDGQLASLKVTLDQAAGAFDVGVGRGVPSKRAGQMPIGHGLSYRAAVALVGDGYWWSGPKTILSTTPDYTGLDDQYECYIVEQASITPDELVAKIGATYRGEGTYDGAVYKHFTVRYREINQVWSIRQTYRTGGWCSVGYVQADWLKLSLVPDVFNLGWKANLETNGENRGEAVFGTLSLPGKEQL